MKTQLKDNIFIEGFVTQTGVDLELLSDNKKFLRDDILDEFNPNLIYEGKTSEIPEDIAKECVLNWRTNELYNNYKISSQYEEYMFKTAKESIQSACNQTYCIIYKEK